MNATADMILQRRRDRRRLAFWRIMAIVAVLVAVLVVMPRIGGTGAPKDHIAQVWIDGVILDDPKRDKVLAEIAEEDAAKALIVRINSPGGSVVGSEALFEALRKVAEDRPVVAVMSEVAASGGFIAAMAADRLIARRNTITGSIGVIAQFPNFTELLSDLGIVVTEVKTSPLKAAPSTTQPIDPEAVAALKVLIDDSYLWFRTLVQERRGLDSAALEEVADGRVFTGRRAVELGLIDEVGSVDEARLWLEETHEVSADLKLVDYDWAEEDLPWPLRELSAWAAPFLPDAGLRTAQVPRLMAVFAGP